MVVKESDIYIYFMVVMQAQQTPCFSRSGEHDTEGGLKSQMRCDAPMNEPPLAFFPKWWCENALDGMLEARFSNSLQECPDEWMRYV